MKKKNLLNKDEKYVTNNSENYKTNLDIDINEIIKKYSDLLIEYLSFITENVKIKKIDLFKFIIIRGLDTMTNVFLHLLLYTKDINNTYTNSQKSFYFYFEFISQISEDDNRFLNLTSRDAMIYVYKKIIFEVKKNINDDNNNIDVLEMKEKIDIIDIYIKLYKMYLYKIIHSYNTSNNKINNLKNTINKLNDLKNKEKIINFYNIIESLYDKIENAIDFFEINEFIIETFLKNQTILKNIKNKINSDDFDKIILKDKNNLCKWLIK